jgi:hypothetical protein
MFCIVYEIDVIPIQTIPSITISGAATTPFTQTSVQQQQRIRPTIKSALSSTESAVRPTKEERVATHKIQRLDGTSNIGKVATSHVPFIDKMCVLL